MSDTLLQTWNSLSPDKRKAFAALMRKKGINVYATLPIARVDRSEPLPLSYAQERLWFLAQLEPHSAAYSITGGFELHGSLQPSVVQRAVDALVQRHEPLRTAFVEEDGRAVQVISDSARCVVDFVEHAGGELDEIAAEHGARTFDLTRAPLLRVTLVALGPERHALLFALHHIIADGWSLDLLLQEFAELYESIVHDVPSRLPELPLQYVDYAAWQRAWLNAGELERQLRYWTEQLGSEHPPLELPVDKPRTGADVSRGAVYNFSIDAATSAQAQRFAQSESATLFMLLLAAFDVVLYRWTGVGDLRVGVPVTQRPRAELEPLIGLFVNTHVYRTAVYGERSFRSLLASVRETALGAQAHADLPFERLVEALSPQRSLDVNPLFQVMYNHDASAAASSAPSPGSLSIVPLTAAGRSAQFDLVLDTAMDDSTGEIGATFSYASELFEPESIEALATRTVNMLRALLQAPDASLAAHSFLDPAERAQLLAAGRPAQLSTFDAGALLPERIAEQARLQPNAVALIGKGARMTYGELERAANQWAQRLRARGVRSESTVALLMSRSPRVLLGALAVWKAGGAFLMLDPSQPLERIRSMLVDAGVQHLLSESSQPVAAELGCDLTLLDRDDVSGEPDAAPPVALTPNSLAYVVYTSGSTGKPKGVAVEHGALLQHLLAIGAEYGMTADDCVLQFSSLAFDASIEQWATPLLHGARVVVRSDELGSAEHTLELLREHGVSVLDVPPAYLRELAEHVLASGALLPVRVCAVGGEALPRDTLERVKLALGPGQLVNAYGPTEAVITPMVWHAAHSCSTGYAPIGRVVGPRASYVLDGDLDLVARGVPGELYLGGSALARGYLGRAALTAERFLPDPFAAEPGARMYRTGDLVRRLPDGTIEYLGRLDHQVKLRGFRVELGEIEAVLLAQPGVREAVVAAQGGALASRLVAYIVGDADVNALRLQLRAAVPEYMVPSQWVLLPELPRSASGKVDRKRLPAPEQPTVAYVAPRSERERVLSEIWRDVLSLKEDVSTSANFFELGGDSIVSIQVVSRARAAGLAITPRQLFEHQTVEALARVAGTARSLQIDQGPASGAVPLTPIQREFFAHERRAPHHYNQALLLRCKSALDPARLRHALAQLTVHHDALRMTYARRAEGWVQHYGALHTADSALWIRNARDGSEVERICEEAQRSLSLERGELLRAVYMDVEDGTSRLLLAVHHLVMDGVSFRVLLEDLQRAYAGAALPAKTSSFGAFSSALLGYAKQPSMDAELAYWVSALRGAEPVAAADGCGQTRAIEHQELSFDRQLTAALLKQAGSAYRTQIQDLLLTALARAAQAQLGPQAALIDLEGHGREDLFDGLDVSRTIGWFTSKYPVRLDARGELGQAIKRVKEALRGVPAHGLGFGVLAQLGDDAQRAALAALPQPRIAFNYLGQFDASFEEAGLFEVAPESHGAISDPRDEREGDGYWIDINGQVYAGELSFGVTFSCDALSAETRRNFLQTFDQELRALVAHCCTPGAFGRTPSDFPLAGLTQPQLDMLLDKVPALEDIYPLTPMQRGMLFHSLYAPELATYVTQLDAAVSGLDTSRFLSAWQHALDRHAILRTGFVWRGLPHPLQVVAAQLQLVASVVDLRGSADAQLALEDLKRAEHARLRELEEAPLFRVALALLDGGRQHFIWTCHHLLLDGWSTARLLDEVLLSYLGRELPPVTGRFSEYLRYLSGRDVEHSEAFWRARIEALEEPTRLASSLPPLAAEATGAEEQRVLTSLSAAQTAVLASFAQREHVTVNSLVQAAWALVLQRYIAQRAVVFGATVSGRPAELAGSEQMLGLFINTQPIIVTPAAGHSIRELVQRVQADNLAAREHEHTPLADIQRWAGLGGQGLFDTLLVFENYPIDAALDSDWEGLAFEGVVSHESTNYPLTIAVNLGSELHIGFTFARAAFEREQVERLGAQLLGLLQLFCEQPEARVGSVSVALASGPRALQLPAASAARAPNELFLDRAIMRHARSAHRDAPAIITADERLSYAELDRRSDALAAQLLRMGVEPERVVGICMPRRAAFLVSALAVWKAGGAFLPLDPRAPAERLRFMVEDAAAGLVLTCRDTQAELSGARVLCVDDLPQRAEASPLTAARRSPENLAYVIYTSGSTGTPKGVAVAHAAVSMHCHAVSEQIYEISPDDCALHFASFSFDASVEQWCVPMLGGAAVRLSDDEPWTPDELAGVLERDRVTVIYPPMSHVMQLAEALDARGQRREGLRVCCVGAEAVPKRSIELIRKTLAPRLIVNGYGPTETVVTPLLWAARPELPCSTAYAPIGSVVGDRSAYVLDAELNLLPPFATGELYIGGSGSARGYHARPQLTAERFVPDPYAGRPGARMYRTGDLVRMLGDGSIEYLARTDHQVKLRGYRIELGEIEAVLLAQQGVSEAYVMVQEHGAAKRLVGYVGGAVAALGTSAGELQTALREALPEHMVPQQILVLEQLPRTRHGKVDRARLPRPDQEARSYERPRGEREALLAEVWSEILNVPQVGREDNFFELGGDSILSILVVSKVRERGYALTPRLLFAHPTLSALADVLERAPAADSGGRDALPPSDTAGEVPLTPIQRMFFESQLQDRDHFNLSILLRATQPLDAQRLERALTALVSHHPALRFRYRSLDIQGESIQQYCEPAVDERLLWREAVAPADIEASCQRAQRSLDLAHGPLLRALLLDVSDGSQRLLFVVHHLASDGVSFRILLEDLQRAYEQLARGESIQLAPNSMLFKTWAERLQQHAGSEAVASELSHWERTLGAVEPELPRDADIAAPPEVRQSLSITLPQEITRALLTAAPAALGAGVQDVILAGLSRALTAWTGRSEHLVELEGHGRDAPFADDTENLDTTRCVGWFTRQYPMLLSAATTAAETVERIKRYREALPGAGLGYGLLRELAPQPLLARMRALPRPCITFNYLGQFDASFEEEGLLLPAAESAGDEVSPHASHSNLLQLDAQVYRSEFECTLQYDGRCFSHARMTGLLRAFGAELEALAQQGGKLTTPYAVATAAPKDGREADDMALKPRQYSGSPVIQLASGSVAAPLFCLHPAGGVVFDYHILAKALAGRRSVYGIQCRTLIDPNFLDTSMEDMASAYMRLIIETQPEPPYYLLGWSFGADLAIETAHLLEQTGRQVAFLGLVDRLVQDDPETNAAQDEENDVLNMACNLLAARYPSVPRKELLLEAHGRRKRGEADRDIVRVLVGRVTGASADAQDSFDLEGLFVMHDVLRNMFRLSESFALKVLHVAPHCWWSSDALATKERAVRTLEQALGQRSAADIDVSSNHMQIVYDADFVSSLARVLRALER